MPIRGLLSFIVALAVVIACAPVAPRIDPAALNIEYRVVPREEFLADPIKGADFGDWELVRHINYYHVDHLQGDLGPAYLLYCVSLAGFETPEFGISVGPDDDARFTADGGGTWTKAPSAIYCRFGLDILDRATAFHIGNGGIRRTTDGGKTWWTIAHNLVSPHVAFGDSRTGWAAGRWNLLCTVDGGRTFQEIALPESGIEVAAISLRTAADGFLLSSGGILYIAGDSGLTWQRRSLGLPPGAGILAGGQVMAAVRFVSAEAGRAVFTLFDKSVWTAETRDGGKTWARREIGALRGRAGTANFLHFYLSRDTRLLTVTDDFYGRNESFVLRQR